MAGADRSFFLMQGLRKHRLSLAFQELIFKAGKESEVGSTGNPYMIRDGEQWEAFAHEVPVYCGENMPSVYMVDGAKYTTGV